MNIKIHINNDIKKIKKSLIDEAKQKGIYENFGQIELLKLEDKYSDYRYKDKFKVIDLFSNWCMNFDDNDLKQL